MPKGGAAPAKLHGSGGGKIMVRAFLITVRIRRACGPPRVRAFVVRIARPVDEWAASGVRAAAALVLMLVRSQRRAHPRRPGRKAWKSPGCRRPVDDFVWCDLIEINHLPDEVSRRWLPWVDALSFFPH